MNDEVGAMPKSGPYNETTLATQLFQEEHNAAANWGAVMEALRSGRARDLSDEPKAGGAPCIVVGSGGSLDLALPLLKGWRGGLICTTSHALSLVRFGAPPTHIVALDPFCTFDEIGGVDWTRYGTKLVTTPTVWPSLVCKWPNEMLLYRQNMGRSAQYYLNTLKHMYSERQEGPGGIRTGSLVPLIRTEVTLFACSPPMQMFVAQVLGYGNVFLVGCDFAYTYGKDRFTDWTVCVPGTTVPMGNAPPLEVDPEWEPHEHPFEALPEPVRARAVRSISGHLQDPVHAYYKRNMICAWRLSGQEVWTTDRGAVVEMPYVSLEHAIRRGGRHLHSLSLRERRRMADEYLALTGAFVVDTDKGMAFVESENFELELPHFMGEMNRRCRCARCGADVRLGDGEVKGRCPRCGSEDLIPGPRADVDENMARFRSCLKAARKRYESRAPKAGKGDSA